MLVKRHHRAIFISDLHLGSRGCQADQVLSFLKYNTCDQLYLVGDIIDLWALSRKSYFPTPHVDVLRKIFKRSNNGTKVTYIIGNHDDYLRTLLPLTIGNIEFVDECVHTTVDDKEFLVIHGDKFDQVIHYAKWLAWFGDIGYEFLLKVNRPLQKIRKAFGFKSYWSLSGAVKYRVKSAVNFIGDYEKVLAATAREGNYAGVIAGHIHKPENRYIDDVLYLNCGDFIESISAIVEGFDGEMTLINWMDEQKDISTNSLQKVA